MSVVFVVVPVIAGGWPIIAAAVLAASAAMGYRAVQGLEQRLCAELTPEASARRREVSLVMDDSRVVAETLMRGEMFSVEKDGIIATFRRDGRGQCTVHLSAEGRSEAELEAAGRELMNRVRQQFAYAKVMEELEARGFDVVQQAVEADQSIRIQVRRW
jgi:hypothetical protein